MEIEFDPAKDASNVEKHRMSLAAGADMDLDKALVREDARFDYGEARYTAIGPVDDRLCVMCFTMREAVLRVISIRRANARERRRYEANQGTEKG